MFVSTATPLTVTVTVPPFHPSPKLSVSEMVWVQPVARVEVKFAIIVPLVRPAIVPVPPFRVAFPVLAVLMALIIRPLIVNTSFLFVPLEEYVTVIAVAVTDVIVAAEIFEPAAKETLPVEG
ncbi:hypothetical protein DSECCO2_631470 [anaerobic digester metagenome]